MPDVEQPQKGPEKEDAQTVNDVDMTSGIDKKEPAPLQNEAFLTPAEASRQNRTENSSAVGTDGSFVERTAQDDYVEKISELTAKLHELDAGISKVSEAKAVYAQLVTEIEDIRDKAVTSRAEIDNIKNEILVRKGALETEVESVLKTTTALAEEVAAASKEKADLDTELLAIKGKENEIAGLQNTVAANTTTTDTETKSLQQKLIDLKALIDTVTTKTGEVTQKTTNFTELAAKADAAQKELDTNQATVAGKIGEIETFHADTQKLYAELFTDSVDKENNTVKQSMKGEIEKLNSQAKAHAQEIQQLLKGTSANVEKIKADFQSENTQIISETNDRFTQLKIDLEKEIRSLLPGAGAAGLASSFFDAKSKYAATPFREDLQNENTKFARAFYWIKGRIAPLTFYVLFVGPLLYVFFYLHKHLDPSAPGNDKITALNLFLRIAYVSPLVAISLFGLSSINLYRRLYEEYNHKQRVMELYHSFKEELADDESQKKELIEIMLKTVKDKPSLVMHHYEKDFFQRAGQLVRRSVKDNDVDKAPVQGT